MAEVTLPAAGGHSTVEIQAKAAFVVLRVPDGVAATISAAGSGAGSIDIDDARFPPHEGGYRSPGYESAANRVDIRADVPAGSLTVTTVDGSSAPSRSATVWDARPGTGSPHPRTPA